jgi:hypothetical protein
MISSVIQVPDSIPVAVDPVIMIASAIEECEDKFVHSIPVKRW